MLPGVDEEDERGLDEWLSQQSGRSPALKPVTAPDALQTDAPDDDLDTYIDQVAPKDTYEPAPKQVPYADDQIAAKPTASSGGNGLNKAAVIASGIGSFLQRKPFDSQFWGGQQQRADRLQHQAASDSQSRQIAQLRSEELAQRAGSLGQHMADNAANRGLREKGLIQTGRRTDAMVTASDAKAKDLDRKGKILEENADANGDRAHRMTEFYVRNGIPLRSVQGLSPDDMKQLSPELEKAFNLAEPQVRAEVGLAGRKAGAESDARFPNEEKLARVRGEIQDTNAAAKTDRAGGGDQEADDVLVLHPHLAFIGDAGRRRYLAENATRGGQSRISADMDSSDRAHSASTDMSDLLEKITVGGWLSDPEKSLELQKQYELYKNEHEGIIKQIARMKGGTSDEREDIKAELPQSLDARAVPQMRGIESFLRNQSAALMQKHGLVTRGSRLYDEFQRSGKISQEAIDRETSDAPEAAPTAAHPQRAARRPAPPTPTLAPDETFAPMKVYNATSPSGKKAQRSYTDDEAAKLKAKGYTLEAVQ